MKMVLRILVITVFCLVTASFSAQAQQKKRADKTSSAKAYYGKTPSRQHYKQKKTKTAKVFRSQSSKRAKADARNRKKYS
jgi:hypothetical protein